MNRTSNRSVHNNPYSARGARIVTHAQFPVQCRHGAFSASAGSTAVARHTDDDRLRETIVALDEHTLRDVIARQGEVLRNLQSSESADQFSEDAGGAAAAAAAAVGGDDDDDIDVPMAREAVMYQIDPDASRQAEADSGDACALIIFIIGFVVFLAWFANLFMLCKETTKRGKVFVAVSVVLGCLATVAIGLVGSSVWGGAGNFGNFTLPIGQ